MARAASKDKARFCSRVRIRDCYIEKWPNNFTFSSIPNTHCPCDKFHVKCCKIAREINEVSYSAVVSSDSGVCSESPTYFSEILFKIINKINSKSEVTSSVVLLDQELVESLHKVPTSQFV